MMTSDQKILQLVDAGRELSEKWISHAVKDAKNFEQANNQIFVLRRTAINLLAHEAYNQKEQHGVSTEEYLMQLLRDIRQELECFEDAEKSYFLKPNEPT